MLTWMIDGSDGRSGWFTDAGLTTTLAHCLIYICDQTCVMVASDKNFRHTNANNHRTTSISVHNTQLFSSYQPSASGTEEDPTQIQYCLFLAE